MAKNGLLRAVRQIIGGLALCALAVSFIALDNTAAAAEARKLALVIGNDAYEQQPALAKAVGDAHAMQATLEKLGFEVRLAENLDYAGMVGTLANFQSSIEPGDTVALHFSGHGVAANGRNYLLPVDFPQPESGRQGEVLLPRLAFDAGEIVDGLRSQGAALTLAVFDACRDNALTTGTRSIGMSRGLVRMDPPRGVFVMFSAGPGELAADRLSDEDAAATSVFTRVFIPILETPGLTLVEIAKRTQVKVSELAATVDHQQFPDYSDRVIGDVVLLPKAELETPLTPPTAATDTEIATVAPTTTPQSSTPPLSSKVVPPARPTADADVALCDSVAGDPYDPLLPASVDRSRLYDLERIIDHALADEEARKSRPEYENLALEGMAGAAVACEAAVKRHPEDKRFVYQQARAMCLSGMSEYCAGALNGLDILGYPSARKFAAFALLSTLEDEGAAGGLSTILDDVHIDDWFGLPRGSLSDAQKEAQGVHDFLKSAGAAGDLEAESLLLLFEEPDPALRVAKLQDAVDKGMPVGLAIIATFFGGHMTSLTAEVRAVVDAAVANGSHLSRVLLLNDYEQDKSPENLRKAKDILAPAIAAGSPAAVMILKKIEADEANLASTTQPEEDTSSAVTPPPTPSSEIAFGDDTSQWANDKQCDDSRFAGPGMTGTTLIEADIGHDATDCRTAFEAGQLTLHSTETVVSAGTSSEVDFGDDAHSFANDGVCDDRRFVGPDMMETLSGAPVGHDATDCRTAYEAGKVTLRFPPIASAVAAAANIEFGDDASKYAKDALCDDGRFEGQAMTDTGLIEADIRHDATDCRTAFEAGQLTLRSADGVAVASALPAVEPSEEKYKALAGREIWIMVSPNGKAKAALIEERLKAAGMSVLINEVENDYNQWDGDLDYEASDTEMVGLVKELISDLYTMDLAIADERSIPNITITPSE